MKRALIVLLCLTFASIGIAAQDAAATPAPQVTFTISGGVQVEWGLDLDTQHSGFNNSVQGLQLKVGIPAVGETKTGTGVYGFITVGNVGFGMDTGYGGFGLSDYSNFQTIKLSWGDITASLFIGPLSINIFQNPGASSTFNERLLKNAYNVQIYDGRYGANTNNIAFKQDDSSSSGSWIYFAKIVDGSGAIVGKTAADSTGGIDIKLSLDGIGSFGTTLVSNNDWSNWANPNSYYSISPYATITAIPNLTLALDSVFALSGFTNAPMGFAAKLAYDIKGEGFVVTPTVGADINMSNSAAAVYGISGGLYATFSKSIAAVNFEYTSLTAAGSIWHLIASVKFGEVDGLTANAAFQMADNNNMGIHFNLAYALAMDTLTLTPYFKGSYNTVGTVGALFLKAGLSIGGIPNTTLGLGWDSSDLMSTNTMQKMGKIGITCKISF